MSDLCEFFLTIALLPSQHSPRTPFTIAITAQSPTISVGSEVWIKVSITNRSNTSLDDSGGFTYDGIDPNLQFDVRDGDGKSVPKRKVQHRELTAGQAVNRSIPAGQTFTQDQRVSAIYDMSKPGKYLIQVSRRASDNPKDGEIRSKPITVIVVP